LFRRLAAASDGASWVDFSNAALGVVRNGTAFHCADELDEQFRSQFLKPTLQGLSAITVVGEISIVDALASLQLVLDRNGLPFFGEHYTREVLDRLEIGCAGSACMLPWAIEARQRCRDACGHWKIPSADNIIAFSSWDISCRDMNFLNAGKIYRADWGATISDGLKDLLRPLQQQVSRSMHPERLALLELLVAILLAFPQADWGIQGNKALSNLTAPPADSSILAACKGEVRTYVSQFPCMSCLVIFCQFRRRCPGVRLEVDFDNAWTSFCGEARCSVRC